MNLQYIRYALEIARTGSISKAAENLSVAQPNLSRAVKELETGLGIAIFERTRTGMSVTPDGERLLSAGERILREVGELETMFEGDAIPRESLSLVFPHADYTVRALAALVRELPADGHFDITLREVGALDAVNLVAGGESRLGIIRIPAHNERYYTDRLAERELAFEPIATLPTVVVTGASFPADAVGHAELDALTAVVDPTAEALPSDAPARIRLTVDSPAAAHALLRADATAYACTLPLCPETLSESGLRQYAVADPDLSPTPRWLELLIYPKFYRLTATDRRLLSRLQKAAETCAKA